MQKDNIFRNHILDLARRSYDNSIFTFTDFLSEAEIAELYAMEKEISFAGFGLFGGCENCERCMCRFGNPKEMGYETAYPIKCLHIAPSSFKFAETLTHRDWLGALMNLGIERELTGDIICREKEAFIFVEEHIADYICENLASVRHTAVVPEICDEVPESTFVRLQDMLILASSERLDGIISKVFDLSRSESSKLFAEGRVFINGRAALNSSIVCRENDRISVRGFGKFIYSGPEKVSKKGRLYIKITRYC